MIEKKPFGTYGGRDISLYVLADGDMEAGITDFGAAVQYIRKGGTEVTLGYSSVADRLSSGTYCGATVGRAANRIAGARYSLGGREFVLSANENGNCLHGGREGFDRRMFAASEAGKTLKLSLESPDGDQGFGGNMHFEAAYSLSDGALTVEYTAESDADTLFSPTCHAYFNLDGVGDILGHMLRINADEYTPTDAELIPTGAVVKTAGTPFDFSGFKPIGRDIDCGDAQLQLAGGYDHNYILKSGAPAAEAYGAKSGIYLQVYTDLPALQFYSGNFIKGGGYRPRDGFCLEPQFTPDAINGNSAPLPVLRAGQVQRYYIRYKFSELRR